MLVLEKIYAFIKRDFQIDTSYQLNFLLTSINSILILFMFFFINKLVDQSHIDLNRYGQDYFSFVLIGYAFFQFYQLALNTFSSSIQGEQTTGSLEALLSTQTSPQLSIIYSACYKLCSAFFQLIIIFLIGIIVFQFNIKSINIGSTILVFFLSNIIFINFGLISAAFIVVLKKGDPFSWILSGSNFILGGAFFPVSVMPDSIQQFARYLPATYSLDALRLSILRGASIIELKNQIISLIIIAAIFSPVCFYLLIHAVQKAKKDGTLVHY